MTSRWTSAFRYEPVGADRIRLTATLSFFDQVTGDDLCAPVGFVSDGTTRPAHPRWLRWLVDRLIGHPLTSAYLRASVLHDAEIIARTAPWWVVHTRYYRTLRARTEAPRVGRLRALAMTTIVFAFGPRW